MSAPALDGAAIALAARRGGVVGAGGAGFPTGAKLSARADLVIANGAECEPLIHPDLAAMSAWTDEVVGGLECAMSAVGASRGVLAVKSKHAELIEKLKAAVAGRAGLSVFELGNYYPAGDEVILVHAVTGKVPPEGGLPLDVGVVVCNVTTLANLARAAAGHPVTHRLVTVAGAVARPGTKLFPIGAPVSDALAWAGGPTVPDAVSIAGGPMMGKIVGDGDEPITKTLGGLIVLPADHIVVAAKGQNPQRSFLLARSNCCQCNYCTDLCPRFLVGHELRPHLLMRRTGNLEGSDPTLTSAFLCSECGLCGYFACVQRLLPFKVNAYAKDGLRRRGVKNDHRARPEAARPFIEQRRVPTDRLVARIGLAAYGSGPEEADLSPYASARVRVPLKQHVGVPAEAAVKAGDRVKAGDVLGRMADGALGADVHASMDGVVVAVVGGSVEIERV